MLEGVFSHFEKCFTPSRTRDINFLGGNHQQIFFLAEWAGNEEKHGRKGNYSHIISDPFYMHVCSFNKYFKQ